MSVCWKVSIGSPPNSTGSTRLYPAPLADLVESISGLLCPLGLGQPVEGASPRLEDRKRERLQYLFPRPLPAGPQVCNGCIPPPTVLSPLTASRFSPFRRRGGIIFPLLLATDAPPSLVSFSKPVCTFIKYSSTSPWG